MFLDYYLEVYHGKMIMEEKYLVCKILNSKTYIKNPKKNKIFLGYNL